MKLRLASLFAAGFFVSACATLPHSATTRGLEVERVVDAIQCELARVYRVAQPEVTKDLDNFYSKAELELRILNNVNASAEATIIVPVSSVVATVTPSAGIDNSASRVSNLKFFMDMKKLRAHRCAWEDPVVEVTTIQQAPHDLGLTTWVRAALGATQRHDQADLDTMSYGVEFIVVPRANGSLGFDVVNWSPKGRTGLDSRDTQLLNISLARKAGEQETRVRIVNWPSGAHAPFKLNRVPPPDARPSGTVPVNPMTEYKLERELQQNRWQNPFGFPRLPIGF